ncbi:hypothetical protein [Bdellovibrio sp. BCCA]|uniref:hypothetical protein n=1 Tax=Bdellovibrio sp. BCCA TaxID=3136281 RepID=UPI0030F08D95
MKNLIALLSVLVLTATAHAGHIDEKNLVSWLNYGLGALSANTLEDGKVQVIVQGAILAYADNRPLVDSETEGHLKDVFQMTGLNALIITFDSNSCSQNVNAADIFQCQVQQSKVAVQGARVDFDGKIVALGKTIASNDVLVQTTLVTQTSTDGSQFSDIKATVSIGALGLNQIKTGLRRH